MTYDKSKYKHLKAGTDLLVLVLFVSMLLLPLASLTLASEFRIQTQNTKPNVAGASKNRNPEADKIIEATQSSQTSGSPIRAR